MSKHRPPSIRRLRFYKRLPPPFVGDPPHQWKSWGERCAEIYSQMMAGKRVAALPEKLAKEKGFV